jgi:outer membrane immunogenic protein
MAKIARMSRPQKGVEESTIMRRFALCASIAALSFAATAASAQQAYRTNTGPYGADFSGFEIGPDAGYGFSSSGPYFVSGGAFGGHVGYNLQHGGLVGGAEADIMGSNLTTGQNSSYGLSMTFLSSLRAKVGYAFGDLMAYGTLGYGWGTADVSYLWNSSSNTVNGAVFGVGAEYALTRNVSFRAELLRYQFGDINMTGPFTYISQSVSASTNMLRIGASVHF